MTAESNALLGPGQMAYVNLRTEKRLLDGAAWIGATGGSRTRYPAQVQVEVYKSCPPLHEL